MCGRIRLDRDELILTREPSLHVKFSAQGLFPTIPLSLSWGRADLKLSEELIAQLDQAPETWKSENSTHCVTRVKMGGDKS